MCGIGNESYFLFYFILFFYFMAAPMAYGISQGNKLFFLCLLLLLLLLFLGPLPRHMEVPRLGVESEL